MKTLKTGSPFCAGAIPWVLGAMLLLQPVSATGAPCKNGAVANRAANAFMKAAKSNSSRAFETALRKHTNMTAISLFALGKYRKNLQPRQRHKFVQTTRRYVARTLASNSRRFQASSHKIKLCRSGVVEGKLLSSNGTAKKVIWRIRKNRVVDVNIQNVWLSLVLRDNYTKTLKRNGGNVNRLIAKLGGIQLEAADRK